MSAIARPISAAVLLAALGACGYAGGDEIDAESAAILARAPVGTAFKEVPAAMSALGFSCSAGRRQFTDAKGATRETEPHLVCERETPEWLICTRRTRAILIQLNGQLSNVLVNVGRFCT
ncbi:MAG: hypothetical protein ACREUB_07480 [Burkholderiales bacterium]